MLCILKLFYQNLFAILTVLTHQPAFAAQSHYATALTAIRHLWRAQVFGRGRRMHVQSHDKMELRAIADSAELLVFGRADAARVGLDHFLTVMWRKAPFPVGVPDELDGVAAVSAFGVRRAARGLLRRL